MRALEHQEDVFSAALCRALVVFGWVGARAENMAAAMGSLPYKAYNSLLVQMRLHDRELPLNPLYSESFKRFPIF